jgi:hypothetical protein
MDIKQTAVEARQNAVNKGFGDPVEVGTRLMLITSELAEALEAHRSDKFRLTDVQKLHVEALLEAGRFDEFKQRYKEYFGFEMADALIRILEGSEAMNFDIEWYVKMKMKYNTTREQKHGGKAY